MEERKDVDDEYRRLSHSPQHVISHVAPSPTEEEVDKSDKGDEDNLEEITAVESSIVVEPRSGDSGPYLEDLKEHGLDDPELRVGEPSQPPPEATGDHSDGEEENQSEMYLLRKAIETEKAEMFQAVMTTISDKLTEEEVKTPLLDKYDGGFSLLCKAIETEKTEMFQAVMTTISGKLTEEEVKKIISDKYYGGYTLLRKAIETEKAEMFQAVMTTISDKLTEEEVKTPLLDKYDGGFSLLCKAIETEKTEMFQAVMTTISGKLTEEEVKKIISDKYYGGYSLLRKAIETEKAEMFQAVMTTISDKLTEEEVKTPLLDKYDGGFSLLCKAIETEKTEMFQAVMTTISGKLTEEELKTRLLDKYYDGGFSLLHKAIETEKTEMFQAVMTTIADKLTEEEVKEKYLGQYHGGFSLLYKAIKTEKVEMFQAVMATISDKLTEEELKEKHLGKYHGGFSLLQDAIKTKKAEMFQAVMAAYSDKLTEEELKEKHLAKYHGGFSLLQDAIETKKAEMFQAVMAAYSDKLTEEELKEKHLAKSAGGFSLLRTAIETENAEMFQAVMATYSDKLAEEELKEKHLAKSAGGFSLLRTAIETENAEMFQAVMATYSDKLAEEEVKDILVEKDRHGGSLLDMNRSGNKDVLDHDLSAIRRDLTENEVKELISVEGDGGFKLLSTAIGTEKAAMKHGQPNTPGPLTVNEDEINPKGITKLLPGPQLQPDAGGDSSQSGENKLKIIDIPTRAVLRFLPTFSLCQCLRLNQELCNSVREYLSDVVVDAERDQPWTVPVDMLTLTGDSSKLTSAEYGVIIEGNNEDLRHLNALLVPGPDFFDIGGEMLISLSPVLRCRWKRHLPHGEAWKVSFSMHNIHGVTADFVGAVSICRRPSGDYEGAWTLVGNEVKMDDADQAFGEGLVAHATVTGFSDLIAAVKMADAGQRTRGYLTKPISGVKIMRWWSKEVHLYNASTKKLGFVQYLPTLLPTSRSGQVEMPVVGGGVASSSDVTPRDPKKRVHDGYLTPWPRDQHGEYQHNPRPNPEYLETKRRGLGICLVVFDKDGDIVRILRQIDCDAGKVIILLDEIHQRQTVEQRDLDQIQQLMQAGSA